MTLENIDEIVVPDSEFGREIGFTSDKFGGYLWRDDERVMISFIVSLQPGLGNLSALMAAIEAKGLRVAAPTPMAQMEEILRSKGFVPHEEPDPVFGPVMVWEKAPDAEERAEAYNQAMLKKQSAVLLEIFREVDPVTISLEEYVAAIAKRWEERTGESGPWKRYDIDY